MVYEPLCTFPDTGEPAFCDGNPSNEAQNVDGVTITEDVDPGELIGTYILGTPTGAVATPEPGSLALTLIGVGLLGLMTVMRKRISPGLPQAS